MTDRVQAGGACNAAADVYFRAVEKSSRERKVIALSRTSTIFRYPIIEVTLTLLSVLVAMMMPWKTVSQRNSILLFVALSVVIALLWHFVVKATPSAYRWLHFAGGIAILAVGIFVDVTVETAILSILCIPLGLGILISAVGEALR